ncbi:MAG: L-histidine N(alpha)-methyltransferase [Melioribacteraceae bacterium]|nr:L-histidine N(alpha)-methyltransferase [Melioribacteraceae bacterium]MCF8412937.1 L-histidine N(alpha)-methyltransferase [Melioribacteraceae bacterium]
MNSNTEDKYALELQQLINGLSSKQKRIPSKYFYDEKGSKLFDKICELEEYYPTRTEMKIMEDNILDIVKIFDKNSLFIEFGSGSSWKTKLILKHLQQLTAYIPVDISEEHLNNSAQELRVIFPNLEIIPIAADYTHPIRFPELKSEVSKTIAYFPGSTLGNFEEYEAIEFLKMVAEETGKNGGLLLGIDMVKDKKVLEAAYNDSEGITAEFNLNILQNINELFYTDFNPSNFEHNALFNDDKSRIEMHLISKKNQTVSLDNLQFPILKGESLLTEYSHKYTMEMFQKICSGIFTIEKFWTDDKKYFSILYLSVI